MKIVTLTLNPAFDMHCFAKDFEPFHENLADVTALEAGNFDWREFINPRRAYNQRKKARV